MGRKATEMTGLTFGKLLVVCEAATSTPRTKKYVVQCSGCGTEKEMLGGNIRRAQKSGWAGCKCSSKARKHGLWGHPAYKTWEGMIARCYNSGHVAFSRYGGRGISVAPEWRDEPTEFIAWAERNGFCSGKQLDRRDNDGNYSPSNCRFVTPSTNSNNKSTNRRLHVGGRYLTIAEASKQFGLNKTTIKERLNRGWSDQRAVEPVGGAA